MKHTLIVDSGSTKTTWCALCPDSSPVLFQTLGINPIRDTVEAIREVVGAAASQVGAVDNIYFYGAGCTPAYSPVVADVFRESFPDADIYVESDMLGAARALCQHSAGIACILGTGANSCFYDGEHIAQQVSPLGWILGDEGSGAALGRALLTDALKHQLPDELCRAFLSQFQLDAASAIEHVYRQPQPNRWLASLVPFIVEHRAHPAMQALLSVQFGSFFRRNIEPYGTLVAAPDIHTLPIHFIGGIAAQFQPELIAAATACSFEVGQILQDPVPALVAYHV